MNRAVVLRTSLGPRPVPARPRRRGRARPRRGRRLRRAPHGPRARRGHRARARRARHPRPGHAAPLPDAAARLRRHRPPRRRRRDGDREPQPAGVQRLQGLLGERRADHPAARQGHRRAASPRRPRPIAVPRHRGRGRGGRASCGALRRRRGAALPRRRPRALGAVGRRSLLPHRLHAAPRHRRPARPQALAEAGFTDVTTVPEQAEPDGDFPTVAFPNPEEKGAMDLALALARGRGRAARARQRSRRRPPRPRRARSRAAATCSSPATRWARCSGTTCSPRARAVRDRRAAGAGVAGLVADARRHRGGARRALRGDAHRLQVDCQPRHGASSARRARASSSGSRRRSGTRWAGWCATRTASAPR